MSRIDKPQPRSLAELRDEFQRLKGNCGAIWKQLDAVAQQIHNLRRMASVDKVNGNSRGD